MTDRETADLVKLLGAMVAKLENYEHRIKWLEGDVTAQYQALGCQQRPTNYCPPKIDGILRAELTAVVTNCHSAPA